MGVVEWLVIAAIGLYLLYRYSTSTHDHWSKKGVRHIKPVPFFGSGISAILRRKPPALGTKFYYDNFKPHRFGGIFVFKMPSLVLRDPELIKQVMVKDFDHFTNRNSFVNAEADPLFGTNLLSLKDNKWRDMRNTLSPAFTASKMKAMFCLVNECASQMTAYIDSKISEQVDNNRPDGPVWETELKSFFTKFTNDVIATTAFGIQVDSMKNPNNEFYEHGKVATNFRGLMLLKILGFLVFPGLMKLLRVSLFPKATSDFFVSVVTESIRAREEKNIIRPDLIHLMMEARKGGKATDEKQTDLTDQDIAAQGLLFFLAGFETSSLTLGFVAHELAVNPDVQNRLQKEIDDVVEEDNGKITYDSIMTKMPYLDMVLSETLRLWPPGFIIDRTVSKPYVIPASGEDPEVRMERGDVIWISVFGLHRDPEHFPDPEKFDPERFSEENKNKIKPFTYLPFGGGPRNCIGMRFALMEAKACLVHLLRKYTLVVTKNTQVPMVMSSSSQAQLAPERGFFIGLKPRSQ